MEFYIILATLRKLRILELDTFNHKMSSSQAKLVHCSLTIVDFSPDKINILQHIKLLFSAVMLAPSAIDGIYTVTKYEKRSPTRSYACTLLCYQCVSCFSSLIKQDSVIVAVVFSAITTF